VKQDGRLPDPLLEQIPWDRIETIAIPTDEYPWSPLDPRSVLHPQPLVSPRSDYLSHSPEFYEYLKTLPGPKKFVCHQQSHAASAFWMSGFEEALCLTYDGGMCNSPWFGGLYRAGRKTGIQALDQFAASHYAKVTSLYSVVTGLLGFSPNKHEGKVTGLAAYGKPSVHCRDILNQLFTTDYLQMEPLVEWFHAYSRTIPPLLAVNSTKREQLLRRFEGIPKEEIAATLQAITEEHVIAILVRAREMGWHSDQICLSGGLFANVKVNQRVKELGFRSIFVSPPMTDDGTALGAALFVASCRPNFAPPKAASMFFGPEFSLKEIEWALQEYGVKCHRLEGSPVHSVVEQLKLGRVVGIFQGRMEFGPRALGSRSILSQATDPEINKSLNARLRRTEFMPFAPITRIEDLHECYCGLDGAEHTAEFMTVTCNCTGKMRQQSPAVVHVDGTARPQIVRAETHPFLHNILTEYKRQTGISSLINTSFNVHEEPIVCSPSDALRGFLETGIDCLYLDAGFLVLFEDNVIPALNLLRKRLTEPTPKEVQLKAVNAHLEIAAAERLSMLEAVHAEAESLRQAAEERERLLQNLTAVIRKLEDRLQLVRRPKELLKMIAERDGQITELERIAEQRLQNLQATHAEADAVRQSAAERDRLLHELTAVIKTLEKQLELARRPEDLLKMVAERDGQIAELERIAAERGRLIQLLSEAIREREEKLERSGRPNDLLKMISERDGQILELERIAQERLSKIEAIHAEAYTLRQAAEERKRALEDLMAVIKARDLRIAQLEQAAAELQSSRKAIRFAASMVITAIRVQTLLFLQPRLGVLHQYPPRPLRLRQKKSFPPPLGVPAKISIVTPSLNQGKYIERTIRSVVEQDYPDFEYIVQDGQSSDGTLEVLETYSDSLAHWESSKDGGQAHAINMGFRHATGDIMAYLNSDDFLLPGTLAYVAQYFADHPEADVVYSHRVIVDEHDKEIGRWIMPPHDGAVLSWVDYLPQETLFWRRRIWNKVGGEIDESFQFAMDWDLILRFRDAGAKFVRLPRFLAAFRVHPLQKTSAHIEGLGAQEMDRLRRRCHGRTVTHLEAMSAAAPYIARHILYDKLSRFLNV
jgi:carbamoyltransferase